MRNVTCTKKCNQNMQPRYETNANTQKVQPEYATNVARAGEEQMPGGGRVDFGEREISRYTRDASKRNGINKPFGFSNRHRTTIDRSHPIRPGPGHHP